VTALRAMEGPGSSVRSDAVFQPCYNCKSDRYTLFDQEYGYDLVRCADCGLLYVNPRPDDQYIARATMLGEHSGATQKAVTGRYHPSKIRRYGRVLRDFYRPDTFQPGGLRWLDIGCGFGEFMESLQAYAGEGLSVSGIDPNRAKVSSAAARGLTVSNSELEDLPGRFDFISLLNVYSHLPNPAEFFAGLRSHLAPGGELLLQTGHVCHLPREYHPRPYDLPDHLSFANQEIIEGILTRLGYEVIDVRHYRASVYPRFYQLGKIVKLLVKVLIRRGERISYLWPKYPNIDMYIRCRFRGAVDDA